MRYGFKWFILPLSLLLQLTAISQGQWQTAAGGGYTYKTIHGDPMKARFYTLKNGLTVILSVNNKEPRIQTLIGVRAGSNNDPREHTGLAHYLEHLLFKGTYRFGTLDSAKESVYINQVEQLYNDYNATSDPAARKTIYHRIDSVSGISATFAIANEYDKMMTAMGAQKSNAHTFVEETVYEEDVPSNAIDKYLAVQAERFRNPVFRLFHTELEAVYEEKNRDDDDVKVFETMLAALFPHHNYGQQTTIGTIEHLKNPNLKAIRDFYNTYYVPDNMAIVMVGDLDPDDVIRKIDKQFSYMKPGNSPEYKAVKETPIISPIIKEVRGPDAESVHITFRLPGAMDNESCVLAMVVSQILNNGKAGLIDLNLNKQQKVLGASAGIRYLKDYSFFVLSGRALQDQTLPEVKRLLLDQLDILKKGNFEESLLKAIINNFKLYEIQGLEDNNNRATSLMDAFIKHRGTRWNEDVAFINDMGKVTRQQVMDYANTHFKENYVLIYKRKGLDSARKVDKPAITPVEVNREAQSDFLRKITAMPATPVKPQWLDYNKDITKGRADSADVLYVQNKDNTLFRLYYSIPMGSYNNRLLPLAAAYLQYLGTDKYTPAEINRQFYNIACSFNVSPGTDATTIVITGLQEYFGKAVELTEHLIRNCRADEAALDLLKGSIQKSRADSKLNKGSIMNGLMQYAMYGPLNPFNAQVPKGVLDSLKAGELVNILHGLHDYKHTIIYYGPRGFADALADIKEAHHLPIAYKPIPATVKFEKTIQTQNEILFTHYDMVQAEVQWLRNGNVFDASQAPVISLFNRYFGDLVFQTIRESKALAYSTYARYTIPVRKGDRYSAVAYVGSQADKMGEAITGMNELLNDIPQSETALATAKKSIKQDIETGRITQDGIIFSYLAAKKMGLDYDIRKDVYRSIDKLAFSDVKQFFDANLSRKPYTYCIMASDKNISDQELKRYGVLKKLTLEDIFGF